MFYSAGPRSIQLNFKLTLIEPKKEAWTEFKSGISFFVEERERERERERKREREREGSLTLQLALSRQKYLQF